MTLASCSDKVLRSAQDDRKNAPLHLSENTQPAADGQLLAQLRQKNSVSATASGSLTPLQVAQLPRAVQRQYRKNLRAQPRTVPLVQGRAAVNAPAATQVVASYKPEAAVVLATDSAQVTTAQSKKGPAVAAGRDAEVPITTTAESWVRPLLPYAAGLAGLGLLYSLVPLPLAGAGWLWALLRRGRKREPETG
jgi:hypothetical protein